jgi:2,4-dienoyl-CoA reductase (NADPH2)
MIDANPATTAVKASPATATLFSPIRIRSMEVKNRIIMPAMILNYPIENFTLSPEWCEFYARGARGGAGLIICGATYSEVAGKQDEHQLGADCDEWLPALSQIADVIHRNGAKAAVQLNHAGRYSWASVTGVHPVAPSPIYTQYTKLVPRALATEEVEQVIINFADAALRCKRAGFDAVELLGSTGYLISQFLSPLTNQREDKYGGSFDGRLTFVHELVRAIKAKTGEDYPLIFRLSSTDNMPGGLDADDERRVAVKLAEWGVDLLNVTAGWHDSPVHQIGPSVPHGHFVPLAARIKQEVDIPVSCAFRITGPELARQLIESGQLDMVTTARALLADPEWPNKAQAGRDEAIRRCVVCCHCFDMGFKRDVTECAVNPELGRKPLERTRSPKNILVVGAGASGLEAARVLKLRGHDVTVIEKSDRIGGKLELAAAAPHKEEFLNLVRYFEFEVKNLGITVLKNTEIDDVALDAYDGVIVAAGSYPRRISIKGEENVHIYMAHDVLLRKVRPEGPVVILGAGLVGGETADLLVEEGIEVSLVDLVAKPFADMGATLKWVMTGRLRKAKVKLFMESTISEISEGKVHVKHDTTAEVGDGEVIINRDDPLTIVPAKSVIIAAGYVSDESMIDRIKRAQLPYVRTGDAIRSRNLRDAVLEGYKAATEWVDGI